MLKLSCFDYLLSQELIAQYPLKERDAARLLVLNRAKGTIEHRIFRDIGEYFIPQDLLVLNDTKVLACRLIGKRKTGGRVEVLLLKDKGNHTFEAFIKPVRVKLNEKIIFDHGTLTGELVSRNEIKFSAAQAGEIYSFGQMPLPPYIKREANVEDDRDYQTVYARREGAIASPTAGLHFTDALLKKIQLSGVHISYLTLHVGAATFKPVKSEDIREHRMDPERFFLPSETINLIAHARDANKRIFAVGTTSLRAIETHALGKDKGETDIFIYPGFDFKIANCLITNFHLPRTTLFMLVCAFAGEELIKKAYQEAIARNYRFYSYGDAMLII